MSRVLYVTQNPSTNTADLYVSLGPGKTADLASNIWPNSLVHVGAKVVFQSIGGQGTDLWVSNGYASGTMPLYEGHVIPNSITVFGNNALFNAPDDSGDTGLWIADLSNNSVREILAGQQGTYNLSPAGFVVAGSYAYFQGTDSTGNRGIWRTDGTNTFEVVPGNAHAPAVLANGKAVVFWEWNSVTAGYDLWSDAGTVLISKSQGSFGHGPVETTDHYFFFAGVDAAGYNSLWATDGKTAQEVAQYSIPEIGFSEVIYAVYGNRVFFGSSQQTEDNRGFVGLSVWNGFSTIRQNVGVQIGVLSRYGYAMVGDSFVFDGYNTSIAHDNTPTLCVMNAVTGAVTEYNSFAYPGPFIAVGDKEVLFDGGSGKGGLWAIGDGTAPVEIVSSTLSPLPVSPVAFFSFNDTEVLFVNFDQSLWITDGTYGGSRLIEDDAQGSHILNPSNFESVGNGLVSFEGTDSNGYLGTWITNGTAEGTYELPVYGGDAQIITLPDIPQPADFMGKGNSNVLFRASASGDTGFYQISNSANVGWVNIGASSTAYALIAAAGDFNGDGTSDVLFRNNASGDTGFYAIVNGANAGWHDVGASSTAYSVVGVGDFNAKGTSDILYRNNITGDTGFYAIVTGANTGWHDVGASSSAYSVVGVGDFNNDGTSDILYRNNTTGDTGFYAIVNGINTGWHDVGASSTAYSVVGVGDFNGDGTSDILYRNNTTGDTGFYAIVHGINTGWHDVGASSTAYSVVGVGDFNGDGTSDILYRNDTTGDTGFYAIVKGVNTGWHDIGASSTAYHVMS